MARSTQEEMEQPAKQWQMEAINTEMKSVNSKLDNLLNAQNGYATQSQLEDIEKAAKKYTDDEIAKLKAKYDLPYKLIWAALTAAVVQTIYLAYQLLFDRAKG